MRPDMLHKLVQLLVLFCICTIILMSSGPLDYWRVLRRLFPDLGCRRQDLSAGNSTLGVRAVDYSPIREPSNGRCSLGLFLQFPPIVQVIQHGGKKD